MSNQQRGEPIRLTNKTAKALREQAKQQRTALYAAATVMSVLLAAAAVLIGIEHLIAVPLIVLLTIALDALIILLARGRYIALTGQAICTEAAARQLRGDSSEQERINVARRDLERIKQDLAMAEEADDEDDEDMYSPASVSNRRAAGGVADKGYQSHAFADEADAFQKDLHHKQASGSQHTALHEQDTRVMPAAQRRRRQARLQVISNDAPDNQAN